MNMHTIKSNLIRGLYDLKCAEDSRQQRWAVELLALARKYRDAGSVLGAYVVLSYAVYCRRLEALDKERARWSASLSQKVSDDVMMSLINRVPVAVQRLSTGDVSRLAAQVVAGLELRRLDVEGPLQELRKLEDASRFERLSRTRAHAQYLRDRGDYLSMYAVLAFASQMRDVGELEPDTRRASRDVSGAYGQLGNTLMLRLVTLLSRLGQRPLDGLIRDLFSGIDEVSKPIALAA